MFSAQSSGGWGAAGAAANNAPNPFGQPSSETQKPNPFQSQPQPAPNNPFASATNPFTANTASANNPFQAQQDVSTARQSSPFSQQQPTQQQGSSAQQPFNPFLAKNEAPTTQTPAPSHSSKPVGTAAFKRGRSTSPAAGDISSEQSFVKPAWSGINSQPKTAKLHSANRNGNPPVSSQTQKSVARKPNAPKPDANARPSDLATKIHAQLAKDGIRPPAWPKNPGTQDQRKAVENFRQTYDAYREKARKSLIKAGLIDDPDQRRRLDEAIAFKGICEDMCPEWEKVTRIVQHDVKKEEREEINGESVTVPSLMVTRHARSSAGQDAPLPMDVRSPAALRRTLNYLIDELVPHDDLLPIRHNFLWDRTRAVRRDFAFQEYAMGPEEMKDQIYCLETIARFHVTALHLLSQPDFASEDFSEQQEIEQLGKTFISLIHAYDDCAKDGIKCENEAEFRGYYVLYNAHEPALLDMIQSWGKEFWDSDYIRTALSLVSALENTWSPHGPLFPPGATEVALGVGSKFFDIVAQPSISYTMACFAEIHFNNMRKSMLQTLKSAYTRPKGIVPKDITPSFLQEYFRFDSEEEAVEYVELHGLEMDRDNGYLIIKTSQTISEVRIPHPFSRSIVERKRGSHTFPEAIHETILPEPEEESLFVDGPVDISAVNGHAHTAGPEPSTTPPTSPPATPFMFSGRTGIPAPQTSPTPATQPTASIFSQMSSSSSTPLFSGFGSSSKPATSSGLLPLASANSTFPKPQDNTQAPMFPGFGTSSSEKEKKVTFGENTYIEPSPPKKATPQKSLFNATPSATNTLFSTSNAPEKGSEPTPSSQPKPAQPSSMFNFPNTPAASKTNQTPSVQSPKATSMFAPSSGSTQASQTPITTSTTPEGSFTEAAAAALVPFAPPAPTPSNPTSATGAGPAGQLSTVVKANDPMENFSRWFLCADQGLMEETLLPRVVHEMMSQVWNNYQEAEMERKRMEEDEKSWAEARRYREYSLSVTYFYRWLDKFRKRRVVKRIQMEKQKARQWSLAENKAKREAAAKAAKEQELEEVKKAAMRKSRSVRLSSSQRREQDLEQKSREDKSIEEALLASGVLNGVRDPTSAAQRAVRGEAERKMMPAGKHLLRAENQRRQKRGLPPLKEFPEPKKYKEGSKSAMLQALSRGAGRETMSMSTGSLRNSTFSSSYRSSIGYNNSHRIAKPQPRVSDPYWRLKAKGLVQMPNGEYLHESLANPMIREGKRFPGMGDYGLSASQSPAPSVVEHSDDLLDDDDDDDDDDSHMSQSPQIRPDTAVATALQQQQQQQQQQQSMPPPPPLSLSRAASPALSSIISKRKRSYGQTYINNNRRRSSLGLDLDDDDADLAAYRKEASVRGGSTSKTSSIIMNSINNRKRAKSGSHETTQSESNDADFLSRIDSLMKEVGDLRKSTGSS